VRISTRLLLAAVVPAVVALVAVVGVLRSSSPIVDLQGRQVAIIQLRTDLNELDGFARSYVANHDELSRQQFLAVYDQAQRDVATARGVDNAAYRRDLATIAEGLRLVRSLFETIVAQHQHGSAPGSPLSREAEELLSTQLYVRSGGASNIAAGLVRSISADIVTREQQTSLSVTAFTILAAVALTSLLLVLRRSINRSLRALKAGTEEIGSGDLDYRIGLSSSDELGELSRSFDQMTGRLQGVTVSKDELEEEVQQRRRAEERAQQELARTKVLQEIAAQTARARELPELGQAVLDVARRLLDASIGMAFRVDEAARLARPLAAFGFPEDSSVVTDDLPIDESSLGGRAIVTGKPQVSMGDEAPSRTVQRVQATGKESHRFVTFPVEAYGKVVGMLGLGFTAESRFGEQELDLYRAIGEVVGVAMENVRLFEAERDIADRLQEALLTLPDEVRGVEFAHAYHSATETARVGGDFYDLFELNHDHVGIVIGDVAGKGIDAAVLTSMVKNTIRAHANERGKTPSRVLELTNEVVFKSTPTEAFVTVFFGILDCRDGRLVYGNAGHTTAVIVQGDGHATKLSVTGPLLGAFADVAFEEAEARLELDELLFLYTDGLTEARRGRELYGEERLFVFLATKGAARAQDVVQDAVQEVLDFAGGGFRDDLAILAVKRVPLGGETSHQQKLEM
jgi:serine phosphatase RsbU (regulator of sigma subunit)